MNSIYRIHFSCILSLVLLTYAAIVPPLLVTSLPIERTQRTSTAAAAAAAATASRMRR